MAGGQSAKRLDFPVSRATTGRCFFEKGDFAVLLGQEPGGREFLKLTGRRIGTQGLDHRDGGRFDGLLPASIAKRLGIF